MARGVRFRCEKNLLTTRPAVSGRGFSPLFLEVGVLTPTNFC